MTSVLIPFASECKWRRRSLAWVTQRYEALGWEVVVGAGDEQRWCKAEAIGDALQRATGDVLVLADADVWSYDVADGVDAVANGAAWSAPFTRVLRLTSKGTEIVLGGVEPAPRHRVVARSHPSVIGGGLVVLTRALYEDVPLDPRFVNWGGEDDSFGWALTTLAGDPVRFSSPLWHLWHPWAATHRAASETTETLAGRYREALGDPVVMRAILNEVKP